jgi:hypothetical protein
MGSIILLFGGGSQVYSEVGSGGVLGVGTASYGKMYIPTITSAGGLGGGSSGISCLHIPTITSAGVTANGSSYSSERKQIPDSLWQFLPKRLRIADPRFQYRSPWWDPRDFGY